MKKKYLLFFILSIILFSCTNLDKSKISTSKSEQNIQNGKTASNIGLAICDKIQNENRRWQCYGEVGALKKNISICKLIPDNIESNDKNTCFTNIAGLTNNISICNELLTIINKDRCYAEVARSQADASLCDKISFNRAPYANAKSNCISSVATKLNDLTICNKIEEKSDKKSCISDIALVNKDATICDKIDKNFSEDNIRDNCFLLIARLKNEASICANVQKTESKERCMYQTTFLQQKYFDCGTVGSDLQEGCYDGLAVLKGDISICNKINTSHFRQKCYYKIAIKNKDKSICDIDEDSFFKSTCGWVVDFSVHGPSACESLKNVTFRNDCFIYAAGNKKNPIFCGKAETDIQVKDKCFKDVALQIRDVSVCEKILDGYDDYKDECFFSIVGIEYHDFTLEKHPEWKVLEQFRDIPIT